MRSSAVVAGTISTSHWPLLDFVQRRQPFRHQVLVRREGVVGQRFPVRQQVAAQLRLAVGAEPGDLGAAGAGHRWRWPRPPPACACCAFSSVAACASSEGVGRAMQGGQGKTMYRVWEGIFSGQMTSGSGIGMSVADRKTCEVTAGFDSKNVELTIINQAPRRRYRLAGRHRTHAMAASIRVDHARMNPPRYFALIPAAGVGARMGAACPKQYLPLAGKPMLRHVLDTFAASPRDRAHLRRGQRRRRLDRRRCLAGRASWRRVSPSLRYGGDTRRQSVLNGLLAMRAQVADDDWVLVHDAARPGLTAALIDAADRRRCATMPVGGLLALPVVDTLKRADSDGRACSHRAARPACGRRRRRRCSATACCGEALEQARRRHRRSQRDRSARPAAETGARAARATSRSRCRTTWRWPNCI